MMTAGHVFWDSCDDAQSGIYGRKATRKDGTELGVVDAYVVNEDWALINSSYGANYQDHIDDNDDYPTVKGHVAEDEIAYWASVDGGPCMSQMGVTTGETRGRIYAYKEGGTWSDCTDMGWEGVVTYADHGKGDSGGPTWHWDTGDAYIVSNTGYYYYPHQLYDPCGNEAGQDSAGVAAYQINSYGYTMGR